MTVDIGFVRGKTYRLSMPHRGSSPLSRTQTLVFLDEIEYIAGSPCCVFKILIKGEFAGEFCIDPERACQMIRTLPDVPQAISS